MAQLREERFSKRKKTKPLAFFLTVAIVVLGLGVGGMVLIRSLPPRTMTIGLYGLDKPTAEAMRLLAAEPRLAGKSSIAIIELEQDRRLADQIGGKDKIDLVLTYDGRALAADAALFADLDDEVARRAPSTLRVSGIAAGRRFALPLQSDFFELACEVDAFTRAGLSEPKGNAAFMRAATRLKSTGAPSLFVAGGEDLNLLKLVAALAESRCGESGYRALVALLADSSSIAPLLDQPLGSGESLRSLLGILITWRESGILHREWLRMKAGDVESFMKIHRAPLVLQSLSSHRAVKSDVIRGYAIYPFPSDADGATRAFVASVQYGAIPASSRRRGEAERFLYALLDDATQRDLAGGTGLAPASASVEALDSQASDVRLWIAASRAALPDLGWASKELASERGQLAAEIRAFLEAGGAGF